MLNQHTYQILTAAEFIAQGTSAGAIMTIAYHLDRETEHRGPLPVLAGRVRRVAREVAQMTGQSLSYPGQATEQREAARRGNGQRRPSNDNRRSNQKFGKRRVA